MAGSGSRDLHDLLDEHSREMPNETDSDDMDYEPATEEDADELSDEGFLERFLEEQEDEDENDGEEGGLLSCILPIQAPR